MDFKELKLKQREELEKLLREDAERLRKFRFDITQKKVKNIREIREVKKEIARILTLLNH